MNIEDIDIGEEVDFEQMLNESFENSQTNSLVDGVIVEINGDNVLVDIGQKVEGRLHISEITINDERKFNVGDKIPVIITNNKGERPAISYRKVLQKEKFDAFIEKYGENFEDIVVEGKVASVKPRAGFVVVDSDGLEYFMPLAQGYLKVVDAVGKKIKAKVLKVNKEQNSIIISRKKLIEDQKALKETKVNEIIQSGSAVEATVKKITSYGMFVDLGGVDGLVNYNEISYKGPVNPSDYFEEGDVVEVVVVNFDKEKGHLSLSIKAALPNPWEEIKDQLEVGDTITVTVSNFESYGAFVDLGNDIEGLLHISEISWNKNVKHPKELLTIGDEVNVEVIELDVDKKRLRVSLKTLQEKPFEKFIKNHKIGDVVKGKIATITTFGAFVTIDEVDGLLHNEELNWDNKGSCKTMFKKGDEVEVKIIKIDTTKENISLSLKELQESPAEVFQNTHKLGDIIKGTVKDIKDFGVFINLVDNLDGLIRTEDLAPLQIEEINKGDEIESVIVNIDTKRNRVRLSVKRLARQKEKELLNSVNDSADMTLGDLIKDKL
jgi:small subunit ribosomal protein S1